MGIIRINGIYVFNTLCKDDVYGMVNDSMVIISHSCEIPTEIREYCDTKGIKILRLVN